MVVGMGLNIRSNDFPAELAEIATACDRHGARPVDRIELLIAWLRALDGWLDALDEVVAAAASRSATLGRRVRVERARDDFDGIATHMTGGGYLVVKRDDGTEQIVTAGDVLHLRAAW